MQNGRQAIFDSIKSKDIVLKKVEPTEKAPPPRFEKNTRGALLESISKGVTLKKASEREISNTPIKIESEEQSQQFDVAAILKNKFMSVMNDSDDDDDEEGDDSEDDWN